MEDTLITKEDIFSIIEKISIFAALPKEGLETIIDRASYTLYREEEQLFHEGDPASEIFIIIKGKIKMVQKVETTPFEIIELTTGSSLGEASVIGIQPHSSTAVVTEQASVMVISRQLLQQLHQDDCELFALFILNMARELARRVKRYSKYIDNSVFSKNRE